MESSLLYPQDFIYEQKTEGMHTHSIPFNAHLRGARANLELDLVRGPGPAGARRAQGRGRGGARDMMFSFKI